jgi:phage gpG-like protein
MIKYSVDQLEAFQRFANALHGVIDPEEILDEAASILLNRIRTRFLAEKDPEDVPWIPSAAGERRRAGKNTYRNGKKYSGTGTLFETGTMFHSIQLALDTKGERAIFTDVWYAPFAQYGTTKMPPRVFLGFGKKDLALANRLIIMRVKEQIKDAFGGAAQ